MLITALSRFPVDERKRPEPRAIATFLIPIDVTVAIPEKILIQRTELRLLAQSNQIHAIAKEGDKHIVLQALVGGKLNDFKLPTKYVVSHMTIVGSCYSS